MTELQRITTDFSEAEDRIRLAGEGAGGQAVVLWMTQRLLNRLVPHLCQWLEQHAAPVASASAGQARFEGIGKGVALSFAQQAAVAALAPQPPVLARGECSQALVLSVDVTAGPETVTLRFKAADAAPAQLGMNATALRQWLGIVYQLYLKAQWPTQAWPQWMEEAHRPASAQPQLGKGMWH